MKTKLIVCFVLGMALLGGAYATSTLAATSTSVDMTLHEIMPLGQGGQPGCSVAPDGLCGQGEVVPLGQATETIEFGPCPGPHCNTRTITLANGTLILHEDATFDGCPGHNGCILRGVYGNPFAATLTDQVVGGTGDYAGVSGTLTGSVNVAGASSIIRLSGTIVLP